jgi:hypothetical protein
MAFTPLLNFFAESSSRAFSAHPAGSDPSSRHRAHYGVADFDFGTHDGSAAASRF